MLKSFIIKKLAARRKKAIEKWSNNPVISQENTLKKLIKSGQKTLFGKDHNFSQIKTYEDYKVEHGYAVRIDKFSDSSIDMYIRCFTKTDDWDEWLAVKERLAIKIKQIVEKNGASFAFPSQSIYVEKK